MKNPIRKFRILILAMGVSMSVSVCFAKTSPLMLHCPDLKSDAEVAAMRDRIRNFILGLDVPSAETLNITVKELQECFPNGFPACYEKLVDYMKKDEASFYVEQPDPRKDPRQQMPEEFLVSGQKDQKYVFRADIEEIAKKKNWPIVKYKSRHSGGFDATASLMMVEVPGSSRRPPVDYDQFINFSLLEDSGAEANQPIPQTHLPTAEELKTSPRDYPGIYTMVTVQHSKHKKPEIVFQKYFRAAKSATFSPEGTQDVSNCVSCHPSGLRQISPLGFGVAQGETQMPPEAWKMVERINHDMDLAQGEGAIEYDKRIQDAEGSLAQVGPSEPLTHEKNVYPTRSQEFIMGKDGISGCAQSEKNIFIGTRIPNHSEEYHLTSSPPIDWRKVVKAMDCQSCHDGDQRGLLTSATDRELISFKIVGDKSMPHGMHHNPIENGGPDKAPTDELNPNERIALANCLLAENKIEQKTLWDNNFSVKCDDNSKAADPKAWNKVLNQIEHPSCSANKAL